MRAVDDPRRDIRDGRGAEGSAQHELVVDGVLWWERSNRNLCDANPRKTAIHVNWVSHPFIPKGNATVPGQCPRA